MVPLGLLVVAQAVRYVEYVNPRFAYRLERPSFMAPLPPPDNGDGREFRGGKVRLLVYGSNNLDSSTPAKALAAQRRSLARRGLKPTLATAKRDWYAASWLDEEGTVRYIKVFVNKDRTITLFFSYPAAQKRRMDPILTRVVRSFRPV